MKNFVFRDGSGDCFILCVICKHNQLSMCDVSNCRECLFTKCLFEFEAHSMIS